MDTETIVKILGESCEMQLSPFCCKSPASDIVLTIIILVDGLQAFLHSIIMVRGDFNKMNGHKG